jgi:hypothetical protein
MGKESIVVIKLGFLASNIKKEVCGVLVFFLKKYEEKKAHNM